MTASLVHGDCLAVLAKLPENLIDAVVTDPPYHLTSTVKRFGKEGSAPAQFGTDGRFARLSGGFMGQRWDGGDLAFRPETWATVFRVMKPGAHLVAFGGTRTHHRIWCAIEDAGFEIRDTIFWMYGSGFPKSHNAGDGWGTALKPAVEPICLARKPLLGTVAENMAKWGTGAINVDGCRVEAGDVNPSIARRAGAVNHLSTRPARETEAEGKMASRQSPEAFRAERLGEALGRWPANIIHDGSEETIAAFPEAKRQTGYVGPERGDRLSKGIYSDFGPRPPTVPRGDTGSAARFFYCAKAAKSDRGDGNKHPTVKPTELMRYLCRLITPVGGLILDPFMGSGSTGKAAALEEFRFLGIEKEATYMNMAKTRIPAAVVHGMEAK